MELLDGGFHRVAARRQNHFQVGSCRKRSLQPAPKVPVPRNDMHGNAGPVAFAPSAGVHVAAKPTPSLRGSDHRDDHSSLQAILSSAHCGVRLHQRHPTKQLPPASIVSFTCRAGRDPCCSTHARCAHISERAPCRTKRLVRQGRESCAPVRMQASRRENRKSSGPFAWA